jgi:hypothetical protein
MAEQSQKAEMSAAIRAQRERHNVPRSLAGDRPPPPAVPAAPPEPQPVRESKKGLLSRLLGK